MMTNKALRLPIILLALMVMGGIIQAVRPKRHLEAEPFRDANAVKTFDVNQTASNITINGHNVSELAVQQSSYKSLSYQQSWSDNDIQYIETKGAKQILVFSDGSTREVTPALFKQLPGSIQVRLSYERND